MITVLVLARPEVKSFMVISSINTKFPYRKFGVREYWNTGVLEWWSIGVMVVFSTTQHSTTPTRHKRELSPPS
jgi:hypothetical protein